MVKVRLGWLGEEPNPLWRARGWKMISSRFSGSRSAVSSCRVATGYDRRGARLVAGDGRCSRGRRPLGFQPGREADVEGVEGEGHQGVVAAEGHQLDELDAIKV